MTPPPHAPRPNLSLPEGWQARRPVEADVETLAELLARHERAARGGASASAAEVHAAVAGEGADAREHLVVSDPTGRVRAWGEVQDRAAGRVMCAVTVDPELDDATADRLADALFDWAEEQAIAVGAARGLDVTQLDSGAFADDPRQQRWLADAGLSHVRSWWQMKRPVDPAEGEPGAFPPPREGVVVRLVRRGPDGMPEEDDLRAVHDVLEGAFADHFNSHAETFDEFLARLRADPGHRWDHWWLAEITDDAGRPVPAGALVATVSEGSGGSADGSYVSYLGVLGTARGRGVARSLLHAVIADAARRGRDRVGLEVDADSPTGAHHLYTSMGFAPYTTTQSWHADIAVREG